MPTPPTQAETILRLLGELAFYPSVIDAAGTRHGLHFQLFPNGANDIRICWALGALDDEFVLPDGGSQGFGWLWEEITSPDELVEALEAALAWAEALPDLDEPHSP